MKYLAALLVLAVTANAAGNYKIPTASSKASVAAQLQASGITYTNLVCDGVSSCGIDNASADPTSVFPDTENTTPAVVISAQATNRQQAFSLVKLLRAGTATQAQKDELLGRLAFILLGQ